MKVVKGQYNGNVGAWYRAAYERKREWLKKSTGTGTVIENGEATVTGIDQTHLSPSRLRGTNANDIGIAAPQYATPGQKCYLGLQEALGIKDVEIGSDWLRENNLYGYGVSLEYAPPAEEEL